MNTVYLLEIPLGQCRLHLHVSFNIYILRTFIKDTLIKPFEQNIKLYLNNCTGVEWRHVTYCYICRKLLVENEKVNVIFAEPKRHTKPTYTFMFGEL